MTRCSLCDLEMDAVDAAATATTSSLCRWDSAMQFCVERPHSRRLIARQSMGSRKQNATSDSLSNTNGEVLGKAAVSMQPSREEKRNSCVVGRSRGTAVKQHQRRPWYRQASVRHSCRQTGLQSARDGLSSTQLYY